MSLLAARMALGGVPRCVWVALLGLALLAGAWLHGRGSGAAAVQADWTAQKLLDAEAQARAVAAALKVEERHRAEYRAIADRFLKDAEDAKLENDRVIAGLRSGAVRVRQRLTCPAMPGAAADTAGVAETGPRGLQPADAELALGIAARADAVARQLNALIEAVKASR